MCEYTGTYTQAHRLTTQIIDGGPTFFIYAELFSAYLEVLAFVSMIRPVVALHFGMLKVRLMLVVRGNWLTFQPRFAGENAVIYSQ